MVRLPGLAGSELSAPTSPLKSLPWMRFVEDIARGLRTKSGERKEEKDGGRAREIIQVKYQNPTHHTDPDSVTSSEHLIMSVRIFPPSDEKHKDFEFDLDKFMGKWSVVVSSIIPEEFS